jgi:excisionase family DNA binding protein
MTENTDGGGGGGSLLTYRDLRNQLRVSQRTLEHLVKSGQLRSVQIGRPGSQRPRRMFRPEDVAAYLEQLAS